MLVVVTAGLRASDDDDNVDDEDDTGTEAG